MAIQMRFLIPKQATEYGPSVGLPLHLIQEQYCSALPVILSMEMVFRMNMITGTSLLSQSIRPAPLQQEMATLPYKPEQLPLVITKHFSSLKKVRQKKEKERQKNLSDRVFESGNLFYWTSLTALIVGAVFQREIMERRYGSGPEYLATELAYPQGIRRGLLAALAFFFAINWTANGGQHDFIIGCAWFIAAWASYGVYRTVRSAKAEPTVHDVM